LKKLAALVESITSLEERTEWDKEEPEGTACLREVCSLLLIVTRIVYLRHQAALTAIATLCLYENDVRREVTDNLRLIPIIHISLSNQHVGVRYAACQCVRALSRAVAVIRTSILDSGLGDLIFSLFKKEDEDLRVTSAALSAICNIVNEFSPLRSVRPRTLTDCMTC
jgi:hypothetical protein